MSRAPALTEGFTTNGYAGGAKPSPGLTQTVGTVGMPASASRFR